jgi:ribonuclease E
MTNRNSSSDILIHRVAGSVVLTMTPQQAQLVAASIWLGDADHTQWLDDLAGRLRTTADRGSVDAGGYLAGEQAEETPVDVTRATAATSAPADADLSPRQTISGTPRVAASDADAVAAFAQAMTDAADAELEAEADLEALAVGAAALAREAVTSAADRTRHAAHAARVERAAATTHMAEIMAETVAQTALALQLHTDEEARTVARAALAAASIVARSVLPGRDDVNRQKAASLAETIRVTAVAKAEETALAAAVVARAAAMAAVEVAAIAADAAMALELEVADTAAAVSAVATATARQVEVTRAVAADLAAATP